MNTRLLGKIAMFALTSGLAGRAWKAWQAHRRDRLSRRGVPPEPVQRWEDEGGAVPDAGPRPAAMRPRRAPSIT